MYRMVEGRVKRSTHDFTRLDVCELYRREKTKRAHEIRFEGGGGYRCAVEREAEKLFPAYRYFAGKAKT